MTTVVAAARGCFAFLLAAFACSLAWSADAPLDARVRQHLDAGEFGPALQLAQQANNQAERDRLLSDVSAAQFAAGARSASLSTASSIEDDSLRNEALGQQAATPVGASGAAGGAALADFQSLIDLITATIAPDTWDTVGGPGSVQPFPGGVYADANGALKRLAPQTDASLASLWRGASLAQGVQEVRRRSDLRKISLPRLERQIQMLHAQGRRPDEAMQHLAGLSKIEYILLYPETGDLVLAGPAGDWTLSREGRPVSADAHRPVLQLDDLVTLLRNAFGEGTFGCSITPRKESLAKLKTFLDEKSKRPLKPGEREKWVAGMQSTLGDQDIEVFGIDPRTRVAQVIVEADYRMKLVGIGLEDGTLGVTSYLDAVAAAPDRNEAMSVLRWWFTLNYSGVAADPSRQAFSLRGPGVKVLSENELLNERGERIHTGQSNEPTEQFAHSFTKHFPQLAAKYPIYAELANIFDLALVAALLKSEDLPGQVDWQMKHFGPEGAYAVPLGHAMQTVQSVASHRVINQKHVIAAVSGGVRADARSLVARKALLSDDQGTAATARTEATPRALAEKAWWWD